MRTDTNVSQQLNKQKPTNHETDRDGESKCTFNSDEKKKSDR
jgi:hypothetical protein